MRNRNKFISSIRKAIKLVEGIIELMPRNQPKKA